MLDLVIHRSELATNATPETCREHLSREFGNLFDTSDQMVARSLGVTSIYSGLKHINTAPESIKRHVVGNEFMWQRRSPSDGLSMYTALLNGGPITLEYSENDKQTIISGVPINNMKDVKEISIITQQQHPYGQVDKTKLILFHQEAGRRSKPGRQIDLGVTQEVNGRTHERNYSQLAANGKVTLNNVVLKSATHTYRGEWDSTNHIILWTGLQTNTGYTTDNFKPQDMPKVDYDPETGILTLSEIQNVARSSDIFTIPVTTNIFSEINSIWPQSH